MKALNYHEGVKPHYRVRIYKDFGAPAVVVKSNVPTCPGPSVVNASETIATELMRSFLLFEPPRQTPEDITWIDQSNDEEEPHGLLQRVTYTWTQKASSSEDPSEYENPEHYPEFFPFVASPNGRQLNPPS